MDQPPFQFGLRNKIFTGAQVGEEPRNPLPKKTEGCSVKQNNLMHKNLQISPCSIPANAGLNLRYRNRETNDVLRKLWCLDKSYACGLPK